MNSSATIVITSALVFYSIGVWSERIQGRLKPWHLVFFVLGLICDTWGTGMMFEYVGGMQFDLHGISGLLAIWKALLESRNPKSARTLCVMAISKLKEKEWTSRTFPSTLRALR